MAYISLPNVNVHRKLNAKRLLTFGIIVMLTSVAVIAVRPANASPEPWWFLPATWHYETTTGSERTMIVVSSVDDEVPPESEINTVGAASFDLEIGEPDENGNATITVPKESVVNDVFYIRTIEYLWFTFHLWGNISATADGSGTLATADNSIDCDVYNTVIGDGSGGFTVETTIGDGTPDPAGSSLVYLPLQITIYETDDPEDPEYNDGLKTTAPMPVYITTGYSETTIDDPDPYPDDPGLDGYSYSATGVPTDPYTGEYTGVITGGMLDTEAVVIITTYSDSIFKEIMVSEPTPSIPSEPITSVTVTPTVVLQNDTVEINATILNGLASSATSDITVYANDTVIGTQTDVTLAAGANTTLTFIWDTTDDPLGTYTIRVELAGEVDGTIYTFSDTYIADTVQVVDKIPGDVNGDGIVDVGDLSLLGKAYRSTPSDPNWDEDCDINVDDIVDVTDLSILGKYYRRSI